MTDHPIQPFYRDEFGVIRFRKNAIVQFLLDAGPFDLNQLALMSFTDQDRQQFAQLIGYSFNGYGELDYVDDIAMDQALDALADSGLDVQEETTE